MKVTQSEFIISAVNPKQYPAGDLPEIALAGRSNVGKSSLINILIQRKNLARTSSTPGKTQMLNYYLINSAFYFVDFPGYGFAKVSKSMREQWGKLIEQFLLERNQLRLVLLVIDLRHPPSKDDIMMYDWLEHHEVPMCIVMTKADKIPKGRWQKHISVIREAFGGSTVVQPMVMFSSETGSGRNELWAIIQPYLN